MLKKLFLSLFSLYSLGAALHAQDETPGWFSTKRLSLSFSTAYHFNPWHSYNNAVATVTERIRLDSFFLEPTGSYDKINGDLILRGELSYDTFGWLSLFLSAQHGDTDSRFEFFPDSTRLASNKFSVALHQQMSFTVKSLGLGMKYAIPLRKKLQLRVAAGVDRHAGNLSIRLRHRRDSRGPLPEDMGERVTARMSQSKWGWQTSLRLSWEISRSLSFLTGINYRRVTFDQLNGPATFQIGEQPCGFTAELVEATNYFGARVKDEPDCYVALPFLTFLTEPDEKARVPAGIDFNSVGLTAGFAFRF